MKYAYVLNNALNVHGGKEQFAFEMADSDEFIYSAITDKNNSRSRPLSELGSAGADIIIFHDIIGINADMLRSLKGGGSRIVFIAHDYYPICERFTLINNNEMLCSGPYYNNCIYCYIDKFPMLANVGRHTQNMLIKLIRPFNSSMKYYAGRKERMEDIMSCFDSVIFPTDKSRKIMMRFFSSIKDVHVIGHFQKPIECGKPNEPVFGFIGHDAYHKGLSILHDALNILTNRSIRVLVYGEVKEKLKDRRITYKGPFDAAERRAVMDSFSILVFPSLWPETWGRVMSEAAVCGKYILPSNIVPYTEVLGEYRGMNVFTHNSPKSLAKAMSHTIKHWGSIYPSLKPRFYQSVKDYKRKIEQTLGVQ